VSLIVITHSHPDHASDAAPLKRLVGAPIAMNFAELKYVDGSERCPSTPASCSTGGQSGHRFTKIRRRFWRRYESL
jgi:glyoxylase-like metal-dependent hydrolase (beta-lactamase superfamily II)